MMRLSLALLAGAGVCGLLSAQTPNTLTPQEKAQGWILLFDGKTLNGWQSRGPEFKVVEGAIVCESGKPGFLASTDTFDNFVLKVEFRTGANTNSGIYLRAAREGSPRQTGYELQIRDFREPSEKTVAYLTGSLVQHHVASPAKIIPGQWNTFEVTANGDHFVVLYNGQKVLDARDSKSASGILGLEFNNAKIEFRNLKLRPLPK